MALLVQAMDLHGDCRGDRKLAGVCKSYVKELVGGMLSALRQECGLGCPRLICLLKNVFTVCVRESVWPPVLTSCGGRGQLVGVGSLPPPCQSCGQPLPMDHGAIPIFLWFLQLHYGPQPALWKLASRHDLFFENYVFFQVT